MQIENNFFSNLIGKVAKNTGIIIVGKVIRGLIEIGITILLARYLGVSNFGIYSFVFAYLGFFTIVTNLGIESILIREISQDKTKADRLTGNVVMIKLALSLFAIALAAVIIYFLEYPLNTKLLVYVASLSFLLSFGTIYTRIFQVDLKMVYPVLVEIFTGILKLILFFCLILLKAPLMGFIMAGIVVNLFGLIAIKNLSKGLIRPKLEIDFKLWKYFLKESWPLAITAVFVIVLTRIDQLMLFHMKGKEAVGYYSAAVTLAEAFNIIIVSFMIPVFPLLCNHFKTSQESFAKLYQLSFKYILMLIVPIAMGITFLSKPVIVMIYGRDFLASSLVLSILIWSEVFVFFGTVQSNIMISINKQKLNLLFTGSSAIMNIIINLFLIPLYGITGAAIATVVSYAGACILSLLLRSSHTYSMAGWQSMLKPIFASAVMAIYIYYTKTHLVLSIMGGTAVFFLTMFLLKGIQQRDINILKAIIWKQNT